MIFETELFIKTDDRGFLEMQTPKIKGLLECVIIDTEFPANITIDANEIKIFDNNSVIGKRYFAVRAKAFTGINNTVFQTGFVKFCLNDVLRVVIRSVANKDIKVIIRYSND